MWTSLKKCIVRVCGCGPSDCQNVDEVGARRAEVPQVGLWVETWKEARALMLRRP